MVEDRKMTVDMKVAIDAIKPMDAPHIRPDPEKCKACESRPCLHCCPARLYTLEPDTEAVHFEHAGCLECGTCLAVCPEDLEWSYPDGGFGVQYRYG